MIIRAHKFSSVFAMEGYNAVTDKW